MCSLWRRATTGVNRNVRMRANAKGMKIWRVKYSAAIVPNRAIAPVLPRSLARVASPAGGRSCFVSIYLRRCNLKGKDARDNNIRFVRAVSQRYRVAGFKNRGR